MRLKRELFVNLQPTLVAKRLIFLDESGMRLGATTRYGWAPRGAKAFGKAPGAWKTVTMIGAIGLNGFRGFANIESGTTSDVFRAFIIQQLVRNLKKGDCVVWDNLSAHKDADAIHAIEAVGASVYFLPPYSPEFNPIEKLWAKLKEYVRRLATDTRELFDDAVARAMDTISLEDIAAWYMHCGYDIAST